MPGFRGVRFVDHRREHHEAVDAGVFRVARILRGSAVVYSATPDSTGTRPPATSLTAAMTARFSAALDEQFSPTVPHADDAIDAIVDEGAATTFCVAGRSRRSSR